MSRSYQNDGSNKTHRLLSAAASVNATSVSARRVNVRTIIGRNAAAALRYLKIYDVSGTPAASDTPILTFDLAASSSFAFDLDHETVNGLGYRITTGQADADTGALTAGDISGLNILYAT